MSVIRLRVPLVTRTLMHATCLLLASLLAAPVVADERPSESVAKAFLEALVKRASAALTDHSGGVEAREKAFRDLLGDGFDMEFLGRVALGKYWRTATEAERATYMELFREFVLTTYGPRLGGFDATQFQVQDAVARGDTDTLVNTSIAQSGGQPIRAGWRVRMVDGKPRIVDIVIEGVSMALNQRTEFASVVTRNGMGGLLEMLRARTQRLSVERPPAKT